jgi:hypothetical protein
MSPPDFRATGAAEEDPVTPLTALDVEIEAPENELAVVTYEAVPTRTIATTARRVLGVHMFLI